MKLNYPATIDINEWVKKAVKLYPQIADIHLTGSRAIGCATPESDYDIVICLDDSCYDQEGEQIDMIEQRLAFDPELRSPEVEVFFLRPGGVLGRWDWGPGNEPLVRDDDDEYYRDCLLKGRPEGDFDRFFKDLRRFALRLYDTEVGFEKWVVTRAFLSQEADK